ncbi:MAG TPA: winged helix-turn-helix domain-containing protein [Pyrinomonadaceae bacterium]|nr:winged helix-turn-helix domain-containing protein [Pyrinomonadaceae bacterium]
MDEPDNLAYEFGPFLLQPRARRLSRDGEPVSLAAPEFELLLLLVRNHGRVVEKKEIMDVVWPDVEVEENNVTVRMSSLRRALGETKGHHPYIQTVSGRGYCVIVPVKELPVKELPAPSSTDEDVPPPAARQNWNVKGFIVYAILLVALLGSALVYGVLRLRKAGDAKAPGQFMKMSRITQTGRVQSATISPDGQMIAYTQRDDELTSLWLQRVGAATPLQLLPPAKFFIGDPAFSPDGNTLYYSKCQGDCQLYKMPVFGGVETPLNIRANCAVAFSPDGGQMAYVRVDAVDGEIITNLILAKPDGTDVRVLNFRKVKDVSYQSGALAWSPDGKTIAVPFLTREGGATRYKVVGIALADGAESTLTEGWRTIRDVVWLPDNRALVINARDEASTEGGFQIWRVSLPNGEARRITNDLNNYARLAATNDGETLMVMQYQWTSSLWIAPAEDPESAMQVTRGTIDRRDGDLGLSLTPDGRLLHVANLGGKRDLWSVNSDGSNLKQLTDSSHTDLFPNMTSDGRYIVFESRCEGGHGLWRMDADGRNAIQLTPGPDDSQAAISPDGKWIYYVATIDRVPKLRKISIDGGTPVSMTDEFAQFPTVSPDGKLVAYHRMNLLQRDQRDIVLLPTQGGPPAKSLPIPKNWGSLMRWAPGGDSLTYRDTSSSSLWRLPLDGTAPTQIMKVRGDRLHNFCYSHDGRRLAYAGGPNLSDVILITRFN